MINYAFSISIILNVVLIFIVLRYYQTRHKSIAELRKKRIEILQKEIIHLESSLSKAR